MGKIRTEAEMLESGIDWFGDMPVGWEIIPLYGCLDEINQKNNPIVTTNILSLTNTEGVIPYSERGNQGNKSKDTYEDYKVVYPDTIVANSMNILIGSVGLSKYEGCVSPVYYVYSAKAGKDIRFINYLFQTERFQNRLRQFANGILEIRLRVSSHDILHQKIAIPKYDEQKAIADYLDDKCIKIDEMISAVKKSIDEFKELRQSVLYEAVTKGINRTVSLHDSGNSFIGMIPSGWSVKRFKYVATINANLVSPEGYGNYKQIAPDCIEKDTGKLIKDRTVAEAGVESWNQLFTKGQLIYSKIRPVLNKVVIAPYDGLCSADMYPLDVHEDIRFVQFAMLSKAFVDQVDLITQDRVKMPKINQDELGGIFMAVPPRYEQTEIVEYLEIRLEELNSVIIEKQKLVDDLEKYKKSLIFEVVTGKRKVV